jgi:hypothetical protein
LDLLEARDEAEILVLEELANIDKPLNLFHQYALGDSVTLWVNKVGPYNNPQETYNYYTLPFCKPGDGKTRPEHKWGGLGEVLEGNELIDSQLAFKFRSECSPLNLLLIQLVGNGNDRFTDWIVFLSVGEVSIKPMLELCLGSSKLAGFVCPLISLSCSSRISVFVNVLIIVMQADVCALRIMERI